MALDAISSLNLDIADREAQGIRESQNIAGIPTGALAGVGGAVNQGLDKLQNIKKLEADTQAKQQQKELLDKGVGGVMEYATELGLDPAKYQRLGAHAKDQNGFINLYAMVKKEKESKDKKESQALISQKSSSVLGEAEGLIAEMNASGSFKNSESVQSRINELQADPDLDPKTAQRLNALGDNIRKSSGTASARATAATQRQRNKDETRVAKSMDTVIKGGRGGQRAFGVPIAKISSIMDGLDTIEGIEEGEFKATQEIAAELGSIISQVLSVGGSTTEGDRRSLTPKSMGGDLDATIQYVSGNPQDALSKDLLNQLKHMLDRERKFWKKEIASKNNLLFNQIRPVFDRKGSNGKFLNRDLMEDWASLLESSDAMSDLSRDLKVADTRGRDLPSETVVTETTSITPTAATETTTVETPTSGDISNEEFMSGLNELFPGE